ncbi:MAG: TIGR01459 family HAD-type hydrolase, partial [Candidatus Pelagibacter sp.]
MKPLNLKSIEEVINDYDFFFIDLWGVVHNGKRIFTSATQVLKNLKENKKIIILISNAPRPSQTVKNFLNKMNFDFKLIDKLITSGDVTRNYLSQDLNKKFFHLGPGKDRDIFNKENIYSKNISDCDEIVCTGLNSTFDDIKAYENILMKNIKYKKTMICANPDEVVSRGTKLEYCAGKIAQVYNSLGGKVIYFGKPFVSIYNYAVETIQAQFKIKSIDKQKILAIGDNLKTDIKGANNFGVDSVLILNGIYKDFEYNNNFNYEKLCNSNKVNNV